MVKHTQTIRRLLPTNRLSVFDNFVGLAFKGLKSSIYLTHFCLRFLFHAPEKQQKTFGLNNTVFPFKPCIYLGNTLSFLD